jgi:hypothetical protein
MIDTCSRRTENIFTFEDNASHTARKRLISNTFSKSFIISSQSARAAIRDTLFGDCLPLVDKAAVDGRPVEVLELSYAYSMDAFVQWQFGKSLRSNFLRDASERSAISKDSSHPPSIPFGATSSRTLRISFAEWASS